MGISGTIRKLMICSAFAAIAACGIHDKNVKSPKNMKPLFEKTLIDPLSKLESKFKNGICSYDIFSGKLTYGSDNGFDISFEIDKTDLISQPFALHCSDDRTILATKRNILIINMGAEGSSSSVADEFGEDSIHTRNVMAFEGEVNVASAVLDNRLFFLSKNIETGEHNLYVMGLDDDEVRSFNAGKTFEKGALMHVHKDIVFIAGEAKKGQPFLVAIRLEEDLFGEVIDARRNLDGPVSFEEKEGLLVLKVGKFETEITVNDSSTDVTDKKTACFGQSEILKCVTVKQ